MNVVEAARKAKGTEKGFRRASWPPFRWAFFHPRNGALVDGEVANGLRSFRSHLRLNVADLVAVDWEVQRFI